MTLATARGSLTLRRTPPSPGTLCPARALKKCKIQLFQSSYGFICSDLLPSYSFIGSSLSTLRVWRAAVWSVSSLSIPLPFSPPDFRDGLRRVTGILLAFRLILCVVPLCNEATLLPIICYCWASSAEELRICGQQDAVVFKDIAFEKAVCLC